MRGEGRGFYRVNSMGAFITKEPERAKKIYILNSGMKINRLKIHLASLFDEYIKFTFNHYNLHRVSSTKFIYINYCYL